MKKKNIIALICTVVLMMQMTITVFATPVSAPADESVPVTTISEANIPSETVPSEPEETVIILDAVEIERVKPATEEEANACLEKSYERKEIAKSIRDGLISLGYAENHPAVVLANEDISNTNIEIDYYKKEVAKWEKIREWNEKAAKYPNAARAWKYMKEQFGWSDTVCAGIMGNFMAECGGCWTSDLNYSVNSKNGLGMVQWIGSRRKAIIKRYGNNPTLEEQLEFMYDELYGTDGVRRQVSKKELGKIMNASTPEECAMAFATYYERCAKQHRAPRKGYARTAYNYFVG